MATEIFREYRFEAAHRLPNVEPGHKCGRMHGHSYVIELHVRGPVDERAGWIMDFADIDAAWAPLYAVLDHYTLNDVEGLENPTSENLAIWIFRRARYNLPGIARVVVRETCKSGCAFSE